MAIYVCGGDETADENPRRTFFYGGYVAPASDWAGLFLEAWKERVLQGPPELPYLHMKEITEPKWRAEHRLTWWQAEDRLDEASRVLGSMGSFRHVLWSMDATRFDAILTQRFRRGRRHAIPAMRTPDYLAFTYFVLSLLQGAKDLEDCDRIDFYIDRNDIIWEQFAAKGFRSTMADNCAHIGWHHVIPLIGDLISMGKAGIQEQAADVFCWHVRRVHSKAANARDKQRAYRMLSNRLGLERTVSEETMLQLAEALAANARAS